MWNCVSGICWSLSGLARGFRAFFALVACRVAPRPLPTNLADLVLALGLEIRVLKPPGDVSVLDSPVKRRRFSGDRIDLVFQRLRVSGAHGCAVHAGEELPGI